MKKSISVFIIITICLVFLGLFTFFSLKRYTSKEQNDGKEIVISSDKLFNRLSIWSIDLYDNKKYDKCVIQNDGTCFISLNSLEKDYGKDISLFKQKGAECLLEMSGVSFNLIDEGEPFYMVLGGCKYNNSNN